MRKRFLSLFCVLALCLGLLSVTALAEWEHTNHSGWTALGGNTTTLANGSYFLSGDVEHNGTGAITVSGTVTLCLNGHVLDLNEQYIKVNSGASLTLCDCTSGTTSGYLGRDGLWHPGSPTDEGATTCNLTGGVITGGNGQTVSEEGYLYNCGGGVVVSGGTFTMTGGKITGNAAYRGGGVYVNNGTFELSGNPTITGNTKADETTVNNVDLYQLYAKPVITIGEDGLSPVASIGVTTETTGTFTSGWSTHMQGKDPADYFFSDRTGYHVALGDDGEASMTANSYTVKFYPNGGEGEMNPQSFTYDASQNLTSNGFTRTGYTFAGWSTSEGGSVVYSNGQSVSNLTADQNGNVTLYAQWTVNTYNVTLHLNGGKFVEGYQGVTSYTYGTTTLLPDAEQMTRSGYRFDGWYADEKFQDGPYTEISDTDVGNKEFYARWTMYNIPETHEITVVDPANGTIRVNPSNGSAGTLITVAATPDEGYELAYITVDGEKISGSTFRMPDHDVTVSAVFVPVSFPFTDVKTGDWYHDAVKYVYYADLMDGVEEHIFAPNDTLTRAMVWTIIARAEGVDTDGGATWYAKAQAWVVAKGISDGENPSAAITRQELVTMLWRLSGEPVVNYALTAPDADAISGWAYEAMRWAVSEGIIEGDENGLIHPTATCTRAEAAAILMRLG